LETREPISSIVLEVAIEVQCVKSILECCKVVAKGMRVVIKDFACPIVCTSAEVRNNKKNLLLIMSIGLGAHSKREKALGHEGTVFRNFSTELGRLANFGFTDSCECRTCCSSKPSNKRVLLPDFCACFFKISQSVYQRGIKVVAVGAGQSFIVRVLRLI